MDDSILHSLVSLVTLTAMEIVLGIDNIVFLSILSGRLPPAAAAKARTIGLILALGMRVLMLLGIGAIVALTAPLFEILGHGFSGRDLILLAGGLFLIGKSTHEIHHKIDLHESPGAEKAKAGAKASFGMIIVQIVILDAVFSLDSVITAVGMARELWVMITAVTIAIIIMLLFARPVGDFVNRHPTMKVLALAFLLLIGVMLVADGIGHHIPKGYIYFAMAFSLFVEVVNMRVRKAQPPAPLRPPGLEEAGA